MDCRKFERLLVLSLEDELTLRQKGILERHLKECPACRKALDDYCALRRHLVALPAEAVPVLPPITRPMTQKRGRLSPFLRRTVLAPAAFAVCLLLIIGFIKLRSTPLSVPVENGVASDFFADVSETEFFEVNFPRPRDYQYFIENLSAEEQEEFFNILQEM